MFSLPLFLYSGIYFVTRSFTDNSPVSANCIMQPKVPVTLLSEAMSYMVSFSTEGELKGLLDTVNDP